MHGRRLTHMPPRETKHLGSALGAWLPLLWQPCASTSIWIQLLLWSPGFQEATISRLLGQKHHLFSRGTCLVELAPGGRGQSIACCRVLTACAHCSAPSAE